MDGQNAYDVLGVDEAATDDEIKKAYRRLAMLLHPDRNSADPDAAEKFRKVKAAYESISDSGCRATYKHAATDLNDEDFVESTIRGMPFFNEETSAYFMKTFNLGKAISRFHLARQMFDVAKELSDGKSSSHTGILSGVFSRAHGPLDDKSVKMFWSAFEAPDTWRTKSKKLFSDKDVERFYALSSDVVLRKIKPGPERQTWDLARIDSCIREFNIRTRGLDEIAGMIRGERKAFSDGLKQECREIYGIHL